MPVVNHGYPLVSGVSHTNKEEDVLTNPILSLHQFGISLGSLKVPALPLSELQVRGCSLPWPELQ